MKIELEWDEQKRLTTLRASGLDFSIVAKLDWSRALTLLDTRREYGENRYITYGNIVNRLFVIAWCYRGDKIGIISLRKANQREELKYDKS